jgi:hypothetical protein
MKTTLKQKIRFALYGTGIGYTDDQLAKMFKVQPGAIRSTISDLRKDCFNVVKQLDTVKGQVQKAKYYMPAGVAEDVLTRLGRPPHLFLK